MISAVIPAYNEAGNIAEFRRRLIPALNHEAPHDWEIIWMIGGQDTTLNYVSRHRTHRERIIYQPERGLGVALKTGFLSCDPKTNWILTMDADLQHLPEEISILAHETSNFDAFGPCPDVVIGRHGQLIDGRPDSKKKISSYVSKFFRFWFGLEATDLTSNFRLYNAEAIRKIAPALKCKDFQAEIEILVRMKRAQHGWFEEVDINFPERAAGKSKLRFRQSIPAYLRLLTI